jgi:hypothetical protein
MPNGAPHPNSGSYAKKFSGKYEYRLIKGGVGTTCLRKLHRPLPKLSSMSIIFD